MKIHSASLCAGLLLFAGCATPAFKDPPLAEHHLNAMQARAQAPKQLGVKLERARQSERIDLTGSWRTPLGSKSRVTLRKVKGRHGSLSAIPHRVDGQPMQGVLATSLPYSLLDLSAARSTDARAIQQNAAGKMLRREFITPDGRLSGYRVITRRAAFGGEIIYNVPFTILDHAKGFEALPWLGNPPVDSLLGADLLKAYDYASFDLGKGELRLASGLYKPDPGKMVAAMTLSRKYDSPVIPIRLNNGHSLLAVVASSVNTGLRIPRSLAYELGLVSNEMVDLAEGIHRFAAGTVALDLAGYELAGVPAEVTVYPSTREEPPYAFLGRDVLEQFVVTIDYGTRRVFFEKP